MAKSIHQVWHDIVDWTEHEVATFEAMLKGHACRVDDSKSVEVFAPGHGPVPETPASQASSEAAITDPSPGGGSSAVPINETEAAAVAAAQPQESPTLPAAPTSPPGDGEAAPAPSESNTAEGAAHGQA